MIWVAVAVIYFFIGGAIYGRFDGYSHVILWPLYLAVDLGDTFRNWIEHIYKG